MNTELLKSKLLEAAFNGSLTHADISTWENVQLGEIGTIVTGSTPSKANSEFYGNDYPFYKPGDLDQGINTDKSVDGLSKIGYEHARHLPANSILVTCIGSIGKTGLIRREGSCNQQINAIIPNDKCNCLYIYYLMISSAMQEKMNFLSRSMTMAILNKSKFSCMEIPLPPLAEQERIVAALEEGFAYIDAVASAKQNLSDTAELLRNKILQAAFDGSLTGDDYSQSIVSLGDVCDIARGGSPRPIKQFITTREDGVNWIKIGDTEKGGKYINSCKEKIIPEGVKKSRMVHKGDFLLTNSMSFGRPYITNIDGCIHDGWLVISPHENTFDKDFLYYLLSSSYVFAQFSDKASGSTVSNLNIVKVIATTVPMPPIADQQRIVAKIEELFTQIDKITK